MTWQVVSDRVNVTHKLEQWFRLTDADPWLGPGEHVAGVDFDEGATEFQLFAVPRQSDPLDPIVMFGHLMEASDHGQTRHFLGKFRCFDDGHHETWTTWLPRSGWYGVGVYSKYEIRNGVLVRFNCGRHTITYDVVAGHALQQWDVDGPTGVVLDANGDPYTPKGTLEPGDHETRLFSWWTTSYV